MTGDTPAVPDWSEFVRLAYRGVLRRPARDDELTAHQDGLRRGTTTPAELLRILVGSGEFAAQDMGLYRWECDERIVPFRTAAATELSRRLRNERPLDRPAFDALWQTRFERELSRTPAEEGLRDYGRSHARRFWETVNAMAILLEGRHPARVLDFGISIFLAFFKRLFPQIELVTSDRPFAPDEQAFFERVSRDAGASGHVIADLGNPHFLTAAVRSAFGSFDLILLTEVLEHLPVHPVHVLRSLLALLRPGGQIYLTTPNYFSRHHLAETARRIHPQSVFPHEGNAEGAHHYRELCMPELLQFVVDAGGEPAAFYFSDCWDEEAIEPVDQWSNMVVVIRRRSV